MSLSSLNNMQAVLLYEQHGLTVEEVAAEMGVGIPSVKVILTRHSSKYRKDCGISNQPTVDEDEYQEFLRAYKNIALDPGTKEVTREKSLRFLIQEHKGRNDKSSQDGRRRNNGLIKIGELNINYLNQVMEKAKVMASGSLNKQDDSILVVSEVNSTPTENEPKPL